MLHELPAVIPPADASRPITSLDPGAPPPAAAKSSEKVSAKRAAKVVAKRAPKVVAKSAEEASAKSAAKVAKSPPKEKTSRRRHFSLTTLVGLAMAAAFGVGIWHDAGLRSDLKDELGRAASAVGGFVLESLIR